MSENGGLNCDCNTESYPSIVKGGYVETSEQSFVINGKPLYFNGFNAYWLMCMAADPSSKSKVTDAFEQASKLGMNVVRTWAFSDGGNKPLQTSPGVYNENMFKALDFVISEAKKHGLHLILSLVNNWDDFGGKKQYCQWAKDEGQYLSSDDDFFSNDVTRGYYKNHVKSILKRHNTITGVAYKDDPTIFAWELMNEPRCQSDLSGKTLEDWIVEMAAEVKSIDNKHLLECGHEGFFGESIPDMKQYNPGYEVGTDFASNNLDKNVDFATIHIYPDQWVSGGSAEDQAEFVEKWIESHIEVCKTILKKPLLIAEFGKSSWSSGYTVEARDEYFEKIFNMAYESASKDGSCSGTTFWQVFGEGMDNWGDGYQVVLEQSPSTAAIIGKQSQKIASLNSPLEM
ncbi:putative mannan endo-1,4-beta-mannosidase 9 [Rutidosis leptorrhynchoides]|uniref:putative mannan endo-1,4-beta-mannosidase 9 n=1 Tax=Rutidosis leptorrhynchoides TaxID=125765 RepID=UPI003A99D9AC